jgi:hypothetical protein
LIESCARLVINIPVRVKLTYLWMEVGVPSAPAHAREIVHVPAYKFSLGLARNSSSKSVSKSVIMNVINNVST